MKLSNLVIWTALFLSGCMSFDTFAEAWPNLKGKDIKVAIHHLGIPDGQYSISGKDIYVWSTSESFKSFSPSVSNAVGSVGGNAFNVSSLSYLPHVSELSCTIKISTEKGKIERMEYDGNNGTCFKYSDRLKPLIEQTKNKK